MLDKIVAAKYSAERIDDIGILCNVVYFCPRCEQINKHSRLYDFSNNNCLNAYDRILLECRFCGKKAYVLNPESEN